MRSSPGRHALTVALLLLASPLLAGCTGDDLGDADDAGLPTQAELTAYFDAIASPEADALAAAQDLTAEGSPAQLYTLYQAAYAAAVTGGGQPLPSARAEPTDDGFQICAEGGGSCVRWTGLAGRGGRLSDFEVNGERIDDALLDLSAQPPIAANGLFSVQPVYAYRSATSGDLLVLLDVTSTAVDVTVAPKQAIYIEQDAILDGTETPSATSIGAGATGTVILRFPGARDRALDGQITLDVNAQGQPSQSVGFGLADQSSDQSSAG